MNWYLQSGKDSDVVISTKIRFSRNLSGYPFILKTKQEIQDIQNKIQEQLYAIGYGLKFIKLSDLDETTRKSLVEKNLITSQFAKNKTGQNCILLNDEENICIMINEKDHLKIQVFSSGLELENTLNLAIELDNKIDEVLNYSKSEKYGYLTSYPNNCGTGLKASVILQLPGLIETRNMKSIFDALSSFEINIKAVENTKDMFEISNTKTLGISELEIIQGVKVIAEKVMNQERQIRKFLAKDGITLEDKIYRSYGILSNCRTISYEESKEYLSTIKLGKDLGILQELTDYKIQKMYLYTKPANLQKYLGNQYDPIELNIKRAEIIKQIMNEK